MPTRLEVMLKALSEKDFKKWIKNFKKYRGAEGLKVSVNPNLKASDSLDSSFTWSRTKEGHIY